MSRFDDTAVNFAAGNGKLYVLNEEYGINDDNIWVSGRFYSITEMTLDGKDPKVVNQISVYKGNLYPESFIYFGQHFYLLSSELNDDGSRDIAITKYSKDGSERGVVYEVQDKNSESFITYAKGSAIIMESIAEKGKATREFNPAK